MVITEINLYSLMRQYGLAPLECYDTFSISLHLDRTIKRYEIEEAIVTYGTSVNEEYIRSVEMDNEYILRPGQAILGCSEERIRIPEGYIGFIQTKGSLARLFISVHCSDSQIEPGYDGKITFEICNMGSLNVRLPLRCNVAQLFIFQTSGDKESYGGRYQGATEPTSSI